MSTKGYIWVMKSFEIKVFGCKVSRHDAEALRADYLRRGYIEKQDGDILIVHGCGVTKRAEKKAVQFIRSLKRRRPEVKIVIAGCLANSLPPGDCKVHKPLDISIPSDYFDLKLTRPLVKIQDGCNQFCSYCIVPHLRGRERSIEPDQIITRIQNYHMAGFREVVITGVHIGRYEYGGLSELLARILAETQIHRIRLSSIEPQELSEDLLHTIRENERIARYLHLPLQSGSDRVLERMNRPYDATFFRNLVQKISDIKDIAIGTDVIVGFPGESKDDFRHTIELLESLPIYNIHPFKFSPREGTPAFSYPEQISGRMKTDRMKELLRVRGEKRESFLKRYIGRQQSYLIEKIEDGIAKGTSSNYIHCLTKNTNPKEGEDILLKGVEIVGEELFTE